MIYTYFFSGFAANGKSSLIDSIEGFVPKGYTVVKIGEAARNVLKLNNFLFDKCDMNEFEKQILASEYYILQFLGELVDKDETDEKNNIVILKDRFILDVVTFMVIKKQITMEDAADLCRAFFMEHSQKVIHNFHLSNKIILINGTENEEFIKKAMQDPARKETLDDFISMQRKFYRIWWQLADRMNLSERFDIVKFAHPIDDPMTPFKIISFILTELKG